MYQWCPMVDSGRSGIFCWVQRQKSAWLDFRQGEIQSRNTGLANLYAFLMGARDDRKVTPGITELSRPRVHFEWTFVYSRIYRRRGLLHRCRLFLSWLCTSSQGCGCSPIKRDRELGSERCEAVCLISTGDVDVWREGTHSTRGTGSRGLWFTCYLTRYAGQLRPMRISAESI